jgi:hypothetical protein
MLWSSWLLAVGLGTLPGCLSCTHPVATPGPDIKAPCQALPDECRKHVYVFLFDGADPLGCANLKGVGQYLKDVGFCQTYFGEVYHGLSFSDEICRIHRHDPEARFALIGFDAGAGTACQVAHRMERYGITIDLLVYIDGCLLWDGPESRPANVWQVVNVVASHGPVLEGTERIDLDNTWHYGAPTHPSTLAALVHGLTLVAEQVSPERPELVPIAGPPIMPSAAPADEMAPTPRPAAPAGEMAPTPRPVVPRETTERGDWDFLKPQNELQPLTEPAAQTERRSWQRTWSR